MINIELGSALIKGKRSLDNEIQEALLNAIGDKLAVSKDFRKRMKPSFRKIMEGVRDNIASNTPGKELPTGWKVRSSKKTGELVFRIENTLPKANRPVRDGKGITLLEIFEYGTGLYGKKKSKYPIKARRVPNLIFQFKLGGWFEGPGPVWHPGVQARGMIRKGNDKLQRDTRKALKVLEAKFRENVKSSLSSRSRAGFARASSSSLSSSFSRVR